MSTYRVDGMTCQGCVRAVSNAIQDRVPGATVEVDLAAGKVLVAGAGDPDTVRKAVEDAGFAFLGSAD